jgi:hypothetical protein
MAPDESPLKFPPTCRPETVTLYEYWRAKCGARRMPSRDDIEPWEIPPRLLPCISLVDVVQDARRYVYRLVGTADVQVRGHDPTGKSVMDGFFGPDLDDSLSCYDTVVRTRAPLLDPEPFIATNGRYATEETIFLPLSNDGINVNKILVFFAFKDVLDPRAPVQLDL